MSPAKRTAGSIFWNMSLTVFWPPEKETEACIPALLGARSVLAKRMSMEDPSRRLMAFSWTSSAAAKMGAARRTMTARAAMRFLDIGASYLKRAQ